MEVYSNHSGAPTRVNPQTPDDSRGWHPALQPMRAAADRWCDQGELRGPVVLHALAIVNFRRSFWRGSAHEHFSHDASRGGDATG
jgi:hypothetical protein